MESSCASVSQSVVQWVDKCQNSALETLQRAVSLESLGRRNMNALLFDILYSTVVGEGSIGT